MRPRAGMRTDDSEGECMARVLIIDDDPNIRLLARKVLGSLGITVLEAQDGAEGLSLTVNRDPDLILCDVMMPVMDGMEFLREWPRARRLRIFR